MKWYCRLFLNPSVSKSTIFDLKGAVHVILSKLYLDFIQIEFNEQSLCPNHVILTGRQMTYSLSNFEYLLLSCFLTAAEFWNFSTVLMMGEKWKYTFWDLPTFTVWCARTVSFWNQRFERYDKHTQGYQMHCHGRKNGKKSHFWLIFGEFHTF